MKLIKIKVDARWVGNLASKENSIHIWLYLSNSVHARVFSILVTISLAAMISCLDHVYTYTYIYVYIYIYI